MYHVLDCLSSFLSRLADSWLLFCIQDAKGSANLPNSAAMSLLPVLILPAQGTCGPFWAKSYLLPSETNHSCIEMSGIHVITIESMVASWAGATLSSLVSLQRHRGSPPLSSWVSSCITAGVEVFRMASGSECCMLHSWAWVRADFWGRVRGWPDIKRDLAHVSKILLEQPDSLESLWPSRKLLQYRLLVEVCGSFGVLRQ